MSAPRPVPLPLQHRAFTVAETAAHGASRRMLQSTGYRRIHPGVYASAALPLTMDVLVGADLLLLPPDACLSHVSALHWYGVQVGTAAERHYSTNTSAQTRLAGICLHRRRGRLSPRVVRGVPVLGPDRTVVDCATQLSPTDLVRAGDWLVRLGLTSPTTLESYALERHLDGVVRARRSTALVRSRVDSVRETDVRLILRASRLPEPEVNVTIVDALGRFLARGDLVYRDLRIVIEYDGWHHERSADQRQRDIVRREGLEAAGWRVIVITSKDMSQPTSIVARVWQAMVAAGYRGVPPRHDPAALRTLRDV